MRSLTLVEIESVSGAGDKMDFVRDNMTFGGSVGSAVGFVLTNTVHGATRLGLFGAAAGLAFSGGYLFGEWLREKYLH